MSLLQSHQVYSFRPAPVSSAAKLYNIYDTLVAFKETKPDEFESRTATEVPTVANGGISKDGRTYTFKIRKGVKLHDGVDLTPEDAVYSAKKKLIVDAEGEPTALLLEPFTGEVSTKMAVK